MPALGTRLRLALAVVPIVVLPIRIRLEELVLSKALDAFKAYKQRTRYRLIPYLW
jgi:protein-S-isoprenylcysteine O-methyltransferase Ste14